MSSKRDSQGRPPKPARKRHLSGIKPVYSSGSWKWRAVAKLGGRQIVGTLRRTQEQAHADYLQLKEDLEVERVSGGAESYLGGAIDSFFANGTRDLSPITAQSLRAVSRQLLRAWDARLHLSTLRAEHIQAYADKSIGEGRHVNSVRKDLSLLRVLFKRAQIDWPGSPKLPRTPKPQTHFFEPNELVEVVERIQNWRPASKIGRPASPAIQMRDSAIVAVLGFTGIRFYEFVRMTRSDVDTKRRSLRVVNAKKGGDVEQVPYGPHMDWAVDLVLENALPDGRLISGPEFLGEVFKRWRKRLNLPKLNGRMLRHSEATRVLHDLGDLAAAQERLRHSSIQTTARYVHVVQSQLRRSLDVQGERWAKRESQRKEQD